MNRKEFLHYTFHHGGAVKAANKDMMMILKALEDNNLETVDYWTKKLAFHFSSHILHSIFWTNLTNAKTEPKGDLLKPLVDTSVKIEKAAPSSRDSSGNTYKNRLALP